MCVCVDSSAAMEAGVSEEGCDSDDSADTVLVPGARRALWEARARHSAPAQRCAKVTTWLQMADENGNRVPAPLQHSFADLFAAPIRTVSGSAGPKGSPAAQPAHKDGGGESRKRPLVESKDNACGESRKRPLVESKDNTCGDAKRTKVDSAKAAGGSTVSVTERKVQSSAGSGVSERRPSKGRDSVPSKNQRVQNVEKGASSDKGSSSKGHSSSGHRDRSKEHRKRSAGHSGTPERGKADSDGARSRTASGGSSSGASPRSGSAGSDRKPPVAAARQTSSGSQSSQKSSSKHSSPRKSSAESSASEIGQTKGGSKSKSVCRDSKENSKSSSTKTAEKSAVPKEKTTTKASTPSSSSHDGSNIGTGSRIESSKAAASADKHGTKKGQSKLASKSHREGTKSSSKPAAAPSDSSPGRKGSAKSTHKHVRPHGSKSSQKHSSGKKSSTYKKHSDNKHRRKEASGDEKMSKAKQNTAKVSTKPHKETSAGAGSSGSKASSPRGENSHNKDQLGKTSDSDGNSGSKESRPGMDASQNGTDIRKAASSDVGCSSRAVLGSTQEDKTKLSDRSNSSGYNDSESNSSDALSEARQLKSANANAKPDTMSDSTQRPEASELPVSGADPQTTPRGNGPERRNLRGAAEASRPGGGDDSAPPNPPASPSEDGSIDSVLDDPDNEGFDEFLENLDQEINQGRFSDLKGSLSSEPSSQETVAHPVSVKQEPVDGCVEGLSEPADPGEVVGPAVTEPEPAEHIPEPVERKLTPAASGRRSAEQRGGRSLLSAADRDGETRSAGAGVWGDDGELPPGVDDFLCDDDSTPPRPSATVDSKPNISLLEMAASPWPHEAAAAAAATATSDSVCTPAGTGRGAPIPADLLTSGSSEGKPAVKSEPKLISVCSSDEEDEAFNFTFDTLSSDSDDLQVVCVRPARGRSAASPADRAADSPRSDLSGAAGTPKRAARESPEHCSPEKRVARPAEAVASAAAPAAGSDARAEGPPLAPVSPQHGTARHESPTESEQPQHPEKMDSASDDRPMSEDDSPSGMCAPDAPTSPGAAADAGTAGSEGAAALADDSGCPAGGAADGEDATRLSSRLDEIERLLARVSAAAPGRGQFDGARTTLDRVRELVRLTARDRPEDEETFLQMCAVSVRGVLCAVCLVLDPPDQDGAAPSPAPSETAETPSAPPGGDGPSESAAAGSDTPQQQRRANWEILTADLPPEVRAPIKGTRARPVCWNYAFVLVASHV